MPAIRAGRVPAALAILALAGGCGVAGRAEDGRWKALAARIDRILDRPELRGASVGIEVRRQADGEVLYEHDADRLLPPASTAKLVTCAAALRLLGKDYRFETTLVRRGPIARGVLRGDLVLVASGDPNLSQRVAPNGTLRFVDGDHTYAGFLDDAEVVPGDPLAVLGALADEARRSGIRRIQGAVVVDDGLFRVTGTDPPELSAACVNDNRIDVVVMPGDRPGDPPWIGVQPADPSFPVENRARTVTGRPRDRETGLRLEWNRASGRFDLTGTIRSGGRQALCVARLPDPPIAAARLLATELRRRGIEIRDPPRKASSGPEAYAALPPVARHVSPPLSEAVKVILKTSLNLHADMLPPLLGARVPPPQPCASADGRRGSGRVARVGRGGEGPDGRRGSGKGGSTSEGLAVVREFLDREGLGASRAVIEDGSGLARGDALSARFLVDLLVKVATWDAWPEFRAGLPVGGVDGTLAARFLGPALLGRVRAKTGTFATAGPGGGCLFLSKSIAGYLERPGETIVFAIIFSNASFEDRAKGADILFRLQEEILEAVAEARREGFRPQTSGYRTTGRPFVLKPEA
jgi:PBP4 family serine-type D-alanyl-D-alanine carboxypeptidase